MELSRVKGIAGWVKWSMTLLILTAGVQLTGEFIGEAKAYAANPEFLPCDPISELIERSREGEPNLAFCSVWNPEFAFRGNQCCAKAQPRFISRKGKGRSRRKANWCAPHRVKSSYCDEMTDDQRAYVEDAKSGKLGDLLKLITVEMGKKGEQAFCSVNNGFLAYGRRVIPTRDNRVQLRTPDRCVDFGTDGMVGMIEWLGRQISTTYAEPQYSSVRLLVGDVAAPRGGCLSGRSGRRGHASHTSGLDADIGFFNPKPNRPSEQGFSRNFDPKPNWWFIKNIFQNPFACVKVIFLDRRLISKVAKVAANDPEWPKYRRFLRHVKGHANHFHVRIGNSPGQPGCVSDPKPELETEDETDDFSESPMF